MLLFWIIAAQATELHVDTTRNNVVKFISDAPVEDFEGITDNIDGYVVWTGNDPTTESEFYFQVDLNTLDTGIGLRNRHMRENYLETDDYPLAMFKGKVISVEQQSDSTFLTTAKGTFTVHGVEQPMTTTGTVTVSRDQYRIQSQFDLDITDYNIEIPQVMFLRINKMMDIRVDFYLKDVTNAE